MPTPTKGARLGGSPAHERLILANLATALFEHGRITTTEAKARRLRPYAEHLITKARRGDLHNRRQVATVIRDKDVLHTLFAEIGPRFANRPGGYVRIVKLGARKGDSAPVVVIELVEAGYTPSAPAAARESAPASAPVVEDSTPVVDDVEVSDDVETGSVEEAPAAADETVSDTTAADEAATESATDESATDESATDDAAGRQGLIEPHEPSEGPPRHRRGGPFGVRLCTDRRAELGCTLVTEAGDGGGEDFCPAGGTRPAQAGLVARSTRNPLALASRPQGYPWSVSQVWSESAPRCRPTTSVAVPPGTSVGSQRDRISCMAGLPTWIGGLLQISSKPGGMGWSRSSGTAAVTRSATPSAVALVVVRRTARRFTSVAHTVASALASARAQAMTPYPQPRSRYRPGPVGGRVLAKSTAVPGSSRPREKTPASVSSRIVVPQAWTEAATGDEATLGSSLK